MKEMWSQQPSEFLGDSASMPACKGVWPALRCPFAEEECRQWLRAGVSPSAGVRDGSAVARGVRKQGTSSGSISTIASLLPNVPAVINRLSQPVAIGD